MPASRSIYRAIAVSTVAVFVVQWLLFELIRMPYRPPADMTTLLGTEKYGVMLLMATLAVGWLLFIAFCWLMYHFTLGDVACFAILLSCLLACVGLLVAFPPWEVSPLYLIWN